MLPAISDAARRIPDIQFDWVVEEGFADVARWHPNVNKVIPVAIRRWRKTLMARQTWQQIGRVKTQLQQQEYPIIVDSQGLLKSAVITRWTKGTTWGYDKHSITEPLACYFYQHKAIVSRQCHAITRNREILSQALSYSLDDLPLDYGIVTDTRFQLPENIVLPERYIMAFHATSREDKEWPLALWDRFIPHMAKHGISLLLPWGNAREQQRAQQLSDSHPNAICLPRCSLSELAALTQQATAVIGMDTGLMHIAAALNKSGIALYPVTQPKLTGVLTAEPQPIESLSGAESLDVERVCNKMLALL